MEYKVVTDGDENELHALGFYGDAGKKKAQDRIDSGYFHKYMYDYDKHKKLIVVPVK